MSDDRRVGFSHTATVDSVGDPVVGDVIAVDLGYHWTKRFLSPSQQTAKHAVIRYRGKWYSACSIASPGRHAGWTQATRELKGWLRFATCYSCTLPNIERARQIVLGQEIVDELGLPAPEEMAEAVS